APTAVPVDIEIAGLSPDNTAVREAVLVSLRDMFRRQSRVSGSNAEIGGMPYLATPASFSRSWIWQAVANASGEDRHAVTQPTDDVDLDSGEIAVMGSVTFVA
ncbi:MAG: hypothetical protein KIT76_17200, partial [Pseudolabrys sp.]|nr:hypothetical protein [Pseudolabrys sp.]